MYIWDTEHDGSFYGFPTQEDSADGVKVAMHFTNSISTHNENICTPESISRSLKEEEVLKVPSPLLSLSLSLCVYIIIKQERDREIDRQMDRQRER